MSASSEWGTALSGKQKPRRQDSRARPSPSQVQAWREGEAKGQQHEWRGRGRKRIGLGGEEEGGQREEGRDREGEHFPGRTRVSMRQLPHPPTPWRDRWLNLSCAVTRVMTHGVSSWQPFHNFITTRTQMRLWPKSAPAPSPPDNNHLTSTCKYPVTDS